MCSPAFVHISLSLMFESQSVSESVSREVTIVHFKTSICKDLGTEIRSLKVQLSTLSNKMSDHIDYMPPGKK